MLDSDGALKSICLSRLIIERDGTAEEQACAIIASFQEFKQLLDDLREVTFGKVSQSTRPPQTNPSLNYNVPIQALGWYVEY